MVDKIEIIQAISLTKLGVEYCFSKPYALEQIIEHISNALVNLSESGNKAPRSFSVSRNSKYLITKSSASAYLSTQIDLVADTNFKVLIYGETGTGKESVARRLCDGRYKDRPFVAVDCGCLNKELAASELFGHKKGSFSGAYDDRKGAFEEANGGTIFLDEIGNLDYASQALLLRAIEEKKIKRVGSNEEVKIEIRVIAASNEKLSNAVQKNSFREDLYYRLNEFEIILPPFRERIEDLELFINFFIEDANKDLGKKIMGVQPELLEKLKAYNWPGNIREIKNIIRRGCLTATHLITSSCMSSEFLTKINNHIKNQEFASVETALVQNEAESLKEKSIALEFEQIHKILKEQNFNKTKAAQLLNIDRKTLYNKLRAYSNLIS